MQTISSATNNSRLRFFADLGSGEILGDTGKRIVEQIHELSNVHASRQTVQTGVKRITSELLLAAFGGSQDKEVLLVPILRAGLAMWIAANDFFGFPETSFLWGRKDKGTDQAFVLWPYQKSVVNRQVIVLDTVIATGDTILEVCKNLKAFSPDPLSLTVLACYAAPEGVQAILTQEHHIHLIIGCLAKTVSADGYLIPLTNGDMGDKLFDVTVTAALSANPL